MVKLGHSATEFLEENPTMLSTIALMQLSLNRQARADLSTDAGLPEVLGWVDN